MAKHDITIIDVMTIPVITKGKKIVSFRLVKVNPSAGRDENEEAGRAVLPVAE